MNRRHFLGSILALGVAPAIVRRAWAIIVQPSGIVWLRFTYAAGVAAFYESHNGEAWNQIGCSVETNGANIVQYHSQSLGLPVSVYPPKDGEMDMRVSVNNEPIDGSICGPTLDPSAWVVRRPKPSP